MSHHIPGNSRSQATFFPEVLDDFVSADNPVRVIDVFVNELDLKALGFLGVVPKDTGRPNYHPAMLLKLYLYGYLNHIQSSRRLEREANRNIELMWLTERLAAASPAPPIHRCWACTKAAPSTCSTTACGSGRRGAAASDQGHSGQRRD